jgi:hypothetical protein
MAVYVRGETAVVVVVVVDVIDVIGGCLSTSQIDNERESPRVNQQTSLACWAESRVVCSGSS